MSLDAAHRSSIYQKLLPVLGDEDANALMSEFPSIEAHELVTKDFLRAELAELRTELRTELRAETGSLRTDLGSLRADMAALETRLTTRLGAAIGASTALLGAIGLLT
jgi:hypothetical protein